MNNFFILPLFVIVHIDRPWHRRPSACIKVLFHVVMRDQVLEKCVELVLHSLCPENQIPVRSGVFMLLWCTMTRYVTRYVTKIATYAAVCRRWYSRRCRIYRLCVSRTQICQQIAQSVCHVCLRTLRDATGNGMRKTRCIQCLLLLHTVVLAKIQ